MVVYIVTLKENASADELQKAKDKAVSEKGTIKDELKLIKGFSVEFPDDTVFTLSSDENINVEQDQVVTTQ